PGFSQQVLATSSCQIRKFLKGKGCILLAISVPTLFAIENARAADQSWASYLGDNSRSHFSTLKQISTENVQKLELACTYHLGDARAYNFSKIQCNPLVIVGVLYGTTPQLKLIALDAATGKERWRFDPFANSGESAGSGVNRGVVYWTDGSQHRIIFSADH